jgi:hypothetical protein
MEWEVEPPLKKFTPDNTNLKVLESYGKVLDDEYWSVWEKNLYKKEKGSLIDHRKVGELASKLDMVEESKVETIQDMLENGANLGIEGEGRWASMGDNNPTVYEFGDHVADSLQTAVKQGIMYGPMRREELPWVGV